jgi:biotin-(acetyl-CoA carboxylase) ligase
MFEISKHAHQRELIVAEFINSIERLLYVLLIEPEKIINKWLNNCLHLNEKISFYENEKIIEGVFTGLNSNGFAIIEINNEIKTYGSINLI